jgi:hypothetical protein
MCESTVLCASYPPKPRQAQKHGAKIKMSSHSTKEPPVAPKQEKNKTF